MTYNYLRKLIISTILIVIIPISLITGNGNTTNIRDTLRGQIKGFVVDSISNKPIESASILVYCYRDSILVKGTISNKFGSFVISKLPLDTFYVMVSSVGYRTRKRNRIMLTADNYTLYLDTIRLSVQNIFTSEVEVIAEKDRLVYKEDKIILNVDKKLGNNAKELLENSPLIETDINGNISLMGSPMTSIFIDGRPAVSLGFENLQDLRLLAISEIERIELIINPSIEFNVKPPVRIINIITRRIDYCRYSATADANINTLNYFGGNIGAAYGYKKCFIRNSYSNTYSNVINGIDLQKNINLNDSMGYLQQFENNKNKVNSNEYKVSGGTLGERSKFMVQLSYSNKFSDMITDLRNNFLENNNFIEVSSHKLLHNLQDYFGISGSFAHNFGQGNGTFTARAGHMRNTMNLMTDLQQTGSIFDDGLRRNITFQKNYSENKNNSEFWEANYIVPWKSIKMSAMYKGSIKNLKMKNVYSDYDYLDQRYYDDPKKSSEQNYKDIEHLFSGELEAPLWGMRIRCGLGLMKDIVENRDEIKGAVFNNKTVNYLAGTNIGAPLPGNQSLFANIMYETSYPSNRQLNPFIDNSDSTNITMGNPELRPAVKSNIDINYLLSLGDSYINTTVKYINTSNSIEQITLQKNIKYSVTTYLNIENVKSLGAGINISQNCFKVLRVSLGSTITKESYNGAYSNASNLSWGSSIHGSLNINNYNVQLDYHYISSTLSAQEKIGANYWADFYLRMYFMERKMSLTLIANDVLKTRNSSSSKTGVGFYVSKSRIEDTRIFSLSISYYLQSNTQEEIPQMLNDKYGDDF